MLRQVYITKDDEIIFQREFGKALDADGFKQAYKQISKDAFKTAAESTKYHDYFQYRIGYLAVPEKRILFFFVSDLSDKFKNIQKELEKCRKEFMDMFESILDDQIDADTFEIFDPTIELIHKNLRPKISLVGFSGVGKTTITRLITAQDIPMEHVPTITGDIGTIKIGKLHFHLWDFAGQEQFSFLWGNFIKGSDAVLLITDSTLENCEKSRYFTELIKKEAPYAHTACIGNKQDLPDAMPILDIERILGMKAYSMIAVDPENRDKMITIIADILEMSGEVSPLLKPLIQRDKIMQEAEEAVEEGDFQKAANLFDELADLSLELGDDRVSQDFHEKAMKIKTMLQQFGDKEAQKEQEEEKEQEKPAKPIPATSTVIPPPTPSSAKVSSPSVSSTVTPPPAPPSGVTPPPAPSSANAQPLPINLKSSLPKEDQFDQLLKQALSKKGEKTPPPVKTSEAGMKSSENQIKMPIPPPTPIQDSQIRTTSATGGQSEKFSGETDPSKLITDLKIKIATVNKTMLDLEMQNITGDLSDEDFASKSKRLDSVKKRLEQQINELENM